MNEPAHTAVTRRLMLAGSALMAIAPISQALAQGVKPGTGSHFAYVGSYTTPARKARGNGINVYAIDGETGAWSHVQQLGDLVNPSFLALSPDGRFLYSVHGDMDYASAFAIDPANGTIRFLNRAMTGGRNGVKQAIDPSGKFMVVCNYASGSIAVLPINADGKLKDQQQVISLPGAAGPHRTEQISSHPHDAVFDATGRFVLVPDKGLDRVFVFAFDSTTGRLTLASSVATRPGAGPRHLVFHPSRPLLWVVNELDSSVETYGWDAGSGTIKPQQITTTLPATFFGDSAAAEIKISKDGKLVFCSNRGDNSVAAYAVNQESGSVTPAGWTPSQGKDPRFIGVDPTGRFLLVANEQGDTILRFQIDTATGTLSQTGEAIHVASPVTIAFSA